MKTIYDQALEFHKEYRGKIEIKSKVALDSREVLSKAYSPGVAQVSIEIGKDKNLAREYTLKRNTVAVVSDGSAILGIGNLGPYAAIPVMEGKAAIFKEFAGVDAFPICLDTQNVEEIIEAVKQIAPVFGGINLEDISAPRCFEIETELQKRLDIPVFHDDQHGTACVVLAGLINALKVVGLKMPNLKVVISGVGAGGVAIAKTLHSAGAGNIIPCDSKGIIYKGRKSGMNSMKGFVGGFVDSVEDRRDQLQRRAARMERAVGVVLELLSRDRQSLLDGDINKMLDLCVDIKFILRSVRRIHRQFTGLHTVRTQHFDRVFTG